MSIWCTWSFIGTHYGEKSETGEVLTYAEGFSNHHPNLDGTHELPAGLAISHIAPWCVPGHNQDGADYSCTGCGETHDMDAGQWLRLDLGAEQGLSFWSKNEDGGPRREPVSATVVLDVAAVRVLVEQMNTWLGQAKVAPIVPSDAPGGAVDGRTGRSGTSMQGERAGDGG